MEFNFNINNLLGNEICCINRHLTPHRALPLNSREYKAQLCEVIDKMGTASAKAQGYSVITSAGRFQMTDQRLYIMKDAEANNGMGAVIGFVKVGHKRLFIYDQHGNNHEMEPLCTLDFYIHESRQRMGCGHKLFEHMLQEEGVRSHQQAIDRPSHKFLMFLQKYYKLKATVPQNNKFVVFDGFFRDKPANAIIDKQKGANQKPPLHPYRRQANQDVRADGAAGHVTALSSRPPSGSLVPVSQLEHEKAEKLSLLPMLTDKPKPHAFLVPPYDLTKELSPPVREFSSLDLLTWDSSGHRPRVRSAPVEKQVLSNVPLQRQNSRENVKPNNIDIHLPSLTREKSNISPLSMGAQGSMYSRHGNSTPPPSSHPRPSDSNINNTADPSKPVESTSTWNIDVSKKIIGRGVDPPLRQRDGPSLDYQRLYSPDSYNSHTYQDRSGHLKVAPHPGPENNTQHITGLGYNKSQSTPTTLQSGNSTKTLKSQALGSAWNIFGVPPNPQSPDRSNAKYKQTRLW